MAICQGNPDEKDRESGKKPLKRLGLGGPSKQRRKEGGRQLMQLQRGRLCLSRAKMWGQGGIGGLGGTPFVGGVESWAMCLGSAHCGAISRRIAKGGEKAM